MKRHLYIGTLVLVIAGLVGIYGVRQERGASATTTAPQTATRQPATAGPPVPAAATFNKEQFPVSDPTSPWVVVNKQRPLTPADYIPNPLVLPNVRLRPNITNDERRLAAVTAKALETLMVDAKRAGIELTLESGYRSYNFQVNLYNRYVQQQGQAVADTQSARAGHSEHQTGLAADLGGTTRPECNVEACFADTPEGKWLHASAYRYGFVIRYPAEKTPVTGYTYEPWHLRYVGVELSTEMHKQGITTLEEFFGFPAAPDYN